MGRHGSSGGSSRGLDVVRTYSQSRCRCGMTTAHDHALLLLLLLLLRPAPSRSKDSNHGILGELLHRLHRGMNDAGRGGHGPLR